ncbi:MAG: 2-C-methyl-D-erythritol 4-phosphate cytidylyltransferase [Pseudomonadota bacterium]|nr:2-C-methyl-D-erythritol 4-phosphate cytidylyltransferase [Pseudomonadota bacterium]
MSQNHSLNPSSNKIFWAVIPAAGVGSRMQANRPKQYLELLGKTLIEHSLQRLLDLPAIAGAVIALDKQDVYWPALQYSHAKPVLIAEGGQERYHSVLNALRLLDKHLAGRQSEAWVLVHDAARPCVRADDLNRLIELASQDNHGGLLALPVRDTMKRQAADRRVEATVDRNGLWHAMTPQMFRISLLINSLSESIEKKLHVTDDASAMELAGYQPLLVACHEDNIKITRPFDLTLASLYMQQQAASK